MSDDDKGSLSGPPGKKEWMTHGYFRTYRFAAIVEDIAQNPYAYLRDELLAFLDHEEILGYLRPYRLFSSLHRFVDYVVRQEFYDDLKGPAFHQLSLGDHYPKWVLPVDAAMAAYGISNEPFFPAFEAMATGLPSASAPSPNGGFTRVLASKEDIENAYYEYFVQDLQLSQQYDDLLYQISDEIFYVLFQNRAALGGLHAFLAGQVLSAADGLEDDHPLRALYTRAGRLRRKAPPTWARNAVFFRDHGMCVYCGVDLSRLIDSLPSVHFDHIVPLAAGGLNDVSNLQLVCGKHNLEKSNKSVPASIFYRRWYKSESENNRRGFRDDLG